MPHYVFMEMYRALGFAVDEDGGRKEGRECTTINVDGQVLTICVEEEEENRPVYVVHVTSVS